MKKPFTTEQKLCDNQSQPLYFACVDIAAFHHVDSGSVNAGMSQNIGKPGYILFHAVIRPGKQMAEIMGENLARLDPSGLA